MKKAIIAVIGSESICNTEGAVLNLKELKTSKVVFLITDANKELVEKAVSTLHLDNKNVAIVLQGQDNEEDVFISASKIISKILDDDIDPENIFIKLINTKYETTAGVIKAASFNYCSCIEDFLRTFEDYDLIKTMFERELSYYPYWELRSAINKTLDMRFIDAREILDEIDMSSLNNYAAAVAKDLSIIIDAYTDWYNFDYGNFLSKYDEIKFKQEDVYQFIIENRQIELLKGMAQSVENCERSPFLIIDLYNNALKKKLKKQYDDAVLRLYRVSEMLGQWILKENHDIDSEDVDTRKVPLKCRKKFEDMRDLNDGKVRIGYRKTYELLDMLDEKIGIYFMNEEEIKDLFAEIRQTTLLHGLKPVDENLCRRFLLCVESLIKIQIPDFSEKAFMLQFPWIREQM